jgi:hypothetical protein
MDHLWSKFTQFLRCPILAEGIIEPLKNLTISELSGSNVLYNTPHCVSFNSCNSEFAVMVKSITRDELIAFAKNLLTEQTFSM